MKLTVFFNGQFWVGVIEQWDGNRLKAAQHIFGTEPNDEEVMLFVQRNMLRLIAEAKEHVSVCRKEKKANPKRLARQAAKEMKQKGVSTYAQMAIKQEYERRKQERKKSAKERKEELAVKKWELKVQKRKEKHRGR
ncbi:YjdF family protein [Thermoactinomyces sp. CICC 10523]|uniref:YjdF family protein n=1 Tax=Thermoactinomyces sp. CICC 10523 TaxID=2767428 RepID=UPI0018DD54A5|nr:YjdF family protein [Thermoactinomyces sp. CICC 10523]MBH8599295.1 YjdF family protein [Thermoactinomyces sp. CICC 10523]